MWATEYAQNGDLSRFTDAEIADACDAPIDGARVLVKHLIESGFIDEKNGKKGLHDWRKHGLKLLESNRERQRKFKEKKKLEEEEKRFGNVTVTATVPYLTIPNLTVPVLYTLVTDDWNRFAKENGLDQVIKVSERRKAGIRARVREKEFDLPAIYEKISSSLFLRGGGSTGWKADFDFVFCSPNNYLKILEGRYDNRQKSPGAPGSQGARASYRVDNEQTAQNARDLEATIRKRDEERNKRP